MLLAPLVAPSLLAVVVPVLADATLLVVVLLPTAVVTAATVPEAPSTARMMSSVAAVIDLLIGSAAEALFPQTARIEMLSVKVLCTTIKFSGRTNLA